MKTIYLAGGCFWGCQKYFDLLPGVCGTEVGYANGPIAHPSYEQVKAHAGHAETVKVDYDPAVLPLRTLLEKYFSVIAPVIDEALHALAARYDQPLAVEHQPLENFYPAEEYHQKYLEKHPDGYCHIHF